MSDLAAKTLQAWFGVEAGSGRLAAALYEANGRWLSRSRMIVASGRSLAGMQLCLKQLRAAMDQGSIEWAADAGWRMTEIGLADCRAGLADAERQERRA